MREVVTLACPARIHQPSRTTTELSVHENLAGTNKKLRFDEDEMYQSQTEVSNESEGNKHHWTRPNDVTGGENIGA